MNRLDVREHFQTISQSYFQVICKPTCIFKSFIQLQWSEILTNLKDIFGKFNLLLFIWKRIYNVPFHYYKTFHFSYKIDYLSYTLLPHTFDLIGSLKIKFYSKPYCMYHLKLYIKPVFLCVFSNNYENMRLKSDVPFTMLYNSIAGSFIKYKK